MLHIIYNINLKVQEKRIICPYLLKKKKNGEEILSFSNVNTY